MIASPRLFQRLPVFGLLLAIASPSAAGLFDRDQSQFLPVDEAFQPRARATDDGGIAVTWRIADGYYLYRHAFDFESATPGVQIGAAQLPDGAKTRDEFFGEIETYRQLVTALLPVSRAPDAPAAAALEVQYQGCADAGLCYPPQTRTLTVQWDGAAARSAGPAHTTAPPGSPGGGYVSEQDRLAGLLAESDLIWILASFFGLGLLLAFTPCVLPMIPILSGILVGSGSGLGAWRGLLLSGVYVLAMAAAYTAFGVLAGLFGANLQALLQTPAVLVAFALLFVALALAMFGVYELHTPVAWQTRLSRLGQGRGGVAGAAAMGFGAALIVGPCLAPPLAGALLYIGASGDAVLGGIALFALGLGMGTPLIALGTIGGGALPKAGAWMDKVRVFFGVILLGVAVWLLARILPGPVILALWALLLAGYAVFLGALEPLGEMRGGRALAKAGGVLGLVYAVILLVGAALGGGDPLHPLQPLTSAAGPAPAVTHPAPFRRVDDLPELRSALAAAARAERPAVVDFYADWCVECVHMARTVFTEPAVRAALAPVAALQVDVTAYDRGDRGLMRALGVLGPPTMLFFGADGEERQRYRLVGAVDAEGFLAHLQRALGPLGDPLSAAANGSKR